MIKNTGIMVASVGLLVMSSLPVFAQSTNTNNIGSATTGAGAGKIEMHDTSMIRHASSTPKVFDTAKVACVGSAVSAREASIDSAINTFSTAQNAAYSARATALQSAYTQTSMSAVHTAVKTAWSSFSSSIKSARTAWSSARMSAWSHYRTAAAACKAPDGTGDNSNSESEVSDK